ncbi:MAG TPA: amylo-alpha-1,6-glucosidase, partial [Gemmatimonadales bacterium]|nr:amylo-alpha-1,6-glucosidase [Gemmatimonadales bacterium]
MTREWLEADGLGGFASGVVEGPRARRYHALLLVARTPPVERVALVNGFEAWLERDGERHPLTVQRYAPGVLAPASGATLVSFDVDPWPRWRYRLADGTEVEQEIAAVHGAPAVCVRWRLVAGAAAALVVRPFVSGRDIHALHFENAALAFDATRAGEVVRWQPYASLPPIASLANAEYAHGPQWYRRFELEEEAARGFDAVEDLAAPGTLTWQLAPAAPANWLLAAEGLEHSLELQGARADDLVPRLLDRERARREALGGRLERAADQYLVRRGTGKSIVAGYPWFTDWGRDTFIALRGLCLATGRLDDARDILLAWAGEVSEGMLPNRFIDQGGEPEFNAVDASLWYVIAAHEWRAAMRAEGRAVAAGDRRALDRAVQAILEGYARGTRYGIAADEDGLLRAGVAGVQLTWMDARVGDWVVTPRVGKPVEIQALWINALRIGGGRWDTLRERAVASFERRFWDEERGALHDVVDVDHVPGAVDASIRPNQLLAVGGLPWPLLSGRRARRIVDLAERELWTPLGPRSLAPNHRDYAPHYRGDPVMRDGAYHQGTVWPWLAGAFVDAWIRARRGTPAGRAEARRRFVEPLLAHLDEAGVGHVSEVADADAPHLPGGCPFQ